MKNFLPILLVLFVFASCKDRFEKTSGIKSITNPTSLKAGPDPIPLNLAKKMIENYGDQNAGLQQVGQNGNKTFSNPSINAIWIELDNLASLVFNLKNEKADGIRIYFAKFGNNVIDERIYKAGLKEDYSYNNTLIITGTKDSLLNDQDSLKIHYHRDYFYGVAPLGFISPSFNISGFKPIPFKLAKQMVENYEANKVPVIDASGRQVSNIPNTSAIWLDLGKLESLVTKLKQEKADGVNIYFARYGDNVADENTYKAGLEKDYSYRNTIIILGAKESTATNINGVKNNYHLDALINNEIKGSAFTFFTDPANKGELCPPPVKCCEIGATLLCPPPAVN